MYFSQLDLIRRNSVVSRHASGVTEWSMSGLPKLVTCSLTGVTTTHFQEMCVLSRTTGLWISLLRCTSLVLGFLPRFECWDSSCGWYFLSTLSRAGASSWMVQCTCLMVAIEEQLAWLHPLGGGLALILGGSGPLWGGDWCIFAVWAGAAGL